MTLNDVVKLTNIDYPSKITLTWKHDDVYNADFKTKMVDQYKNIHEAEVHCSIMLRSLDVLEVGVPNEKSLFTITIPEDKTNGES